MQFVFVFLVVLQELVDFRDIVVNLLPQNHSSLVSPTSSNILNSISSTPKHHHRHIVILNMLHTFPIRTDRQLKITNPILRQGVSSTLQHYHIWAVRTNHNIGNLLEDIYIVGIVDSFSQGYIGAVVSSDPLSH